MTSVVLACAVLLAAGSGEQGSPPATFAIIVGVNQNVDEDAPPLRYADDDAARYFDLFSVLGTRKYLLADLDGSTERLHHQAAAEARPPTVESFALTIQEATRDIAQARARGIETALYFVYAGHGNVQQGQGYITLSDGRVSGRQLADELVAAIDADQTHLIVDACYSIFLAYSRGPGGRRRPIEGFTHLPGITDNDRVGLLLSTSAARESHEWEAFQAGVFSHEVRSGLYGAADVDHDGSVSYREIAAFVEHANAAIPNERFRPRVFARPPKHTEQLLDLRSALARRVEVPEQVHGHYLLEDSQGIRIMDFHNGPNQEARFVRPIQTSRLYLRHVQEQREYVLPPTEGAVDVGGLVAQTPRTEVRGAAHEAFSLLFTLPFGQDVVSAFEYSKPTDLYVTWTEEPWLSPGTQRILGWTGIGVGGAALATGLGLTLSAQGLLDDSKSTTSNRAAIKRNEMISSQNAAAIVLYSVGTASLAAGLLMLLWGDDADLDAPAVVGVSGESVNVFFAF